MEAPTLKLTVEKGPKDVEGKIKECKLPRSNKIRIGRVVKGNNFTIKDEGVSSNHLLIEFNTTTSKWVLSDLDSSNGTFLNSVLIDANTEYVLNNDDTIKIGEKTSMKVTIDGEEDQKLKGKQTRGAKKTAKTAATVSASTSVAEPEDAKEVEEVDGRQLRRNARRGAAAAAAAPPGVEKVPVRRGRPRKAIVEVGSLSVGVDETSEFVEVLGERRVSVKNEPTDELDAAPSSTSEKWTLERLQKMTLGEYFDYLEVYLVNQIREETDAINKGMIEKAEQTKKYWTEQQKLKNKAPLA